jgi:gas vesicle protein
MKTNNTLVGILSGMAAGALLGILFAPDKGSKTRKKIKRNSNRYAADAREKVEDALDTFTEKYDTLKSEVKELYADGKEQLKNRIDQEKI